MRSELRGGRADVRELGSVLQPVDHARARRSRCRATRTSTGSGCASTRPRARRSSAGRAGWASASRPGSTSAPRRRGSCRRRRGGGSTSTIRGTRSGDRATRCSSRSARATSSRPRSRWHALYALIANGGKLVEPHLVSQIEEPSPNEQAPVVVRTVRPKPPRDAGLNPANIRIVQEGLVDAAQNGSYGTSAAIFGGFPISIAGKTGTAEKWQKIPGYPNGKLLDQSWWCGYGPDRRAPRSSSAR